MTNPSNPAASVNGVLCYQRKKTHDLWEDVNSINLSSLKGGEGVRLGLRAKEVLKLFAGLKVLYDNAATYGVAPGTHRYLRADAGGLLTKVAELLDSGRAGDLLAAFVGWAGESKDNLASALQDTEGNTLISFDAAIGVARIRKFLREAEDNLQNADESYWQALLERETWVLAQLYAAPLIIVRGQAYVGRSIANQGGNVVDFMYRNALTQNALIVELKTPTTPLLMREPYRNGVFSPSRELAGATQQLLHARQSLQEEYLALVRHDSVGFQIFGTRALLVVGSLPQESERLRSFEIYRNAQRGIEIVTFSELLEKARLLVDALVA